MASASLPEWLGHCEPCQNIWRRLAQPHTTHDVNLGSSKEALATQCHTHKPLLQAFVGYVREIQQHCADPEHHLHDEKSTDVDIYYGSPGSSVQMVGSNLELGWAWHLLLVKKVSVPHHPGTGRILNPKWADVGLLKQWKEQCLLTHGATCENPFKVWPTRPAYLIDVANKCLVAGCVSEAFVALSYRYGRALVPTIDAAALERLQEPHALDAPDCDGYLSPVIRHAIGLTSLIGERYLWSDALCIPHVNEELRTYELLMMGSIYANAILTIIAQDGDSQYGLPGLQGISPPREMGQRIIPFGSENLIVRNTGKLDLARGSDYHSRAWTFQEYRMSRRRVIFKNQELHWECQCSIWHEEMILGAEIDKYTPDLKQSVIMSGFPDLHCLHDIISDFSKTELRYDEDSLPALSGMLSVLSRSFTGGFLYGIPEMFFERGLGWCPRYRHTNLRRGIMSGRPVEKRLSPTGLPSWSWVGWRGFIAPFKSGEAARIDASGGLWTEETIPVTQWYTSKSPRDLPEKRRRIRPTWFENRETYKQDIAKPLTPGWSRHDPPATGKFPHLYPDGCGDYIFKHANMPEGTESIGAWFYPFPVPAIQISTPPFTPEQTSYLFCNTWGARLWGRQAGKRNTATLYNSAGREVGYLHLHNEDDLSLFPNSGTPGDPEVVPSLPVDLVLLYKSRRYSRMWYEEEQRWGHPLVSSDWYQVLWVEWKEGVAYRLASGEVKVEEWEKLDAKTVDLVLG